MTLEDNLVLPDENGEAVSLLDYVVLDTYFVASDPALLAEYAAGAKIIVKEDNIIMQLGITADGQPAAPVQLLSGIEISQSAVVIKRGDTVRLSVTRNPASDTTAIFWSCSDTSVAMVNSDGLLVAVGEGVAIITATCGNYTASCTAIVEPTVEEELSMFERIMAFFTMIIQMFIDFFGNIG